MGQDVGIGKIDVVGRPLVVPPDIGDTVVRTEIGSVATEPIEVAIEDVAGVLLHAVIEKAHRVAIVRSIPVPVLDLAPGTQNLGEDEGVISLGEIVIEELIRFIGIAVRVSAADIVVILRLMQKTIAPPAEELIRRMLSGIQAQPIVVNGVAQPCDPAIQHLDRMLVLIAAGIIGVAVELPGMAQVIGAAADEIEVASLNGLWPCETRRVTDAPEVTIVFGTDIDELRQLLPHRSAVTVVVSPLVHARTTVVVERVDVVLMVGHVEVFGSHAGILAEVGPIPVVIHDNVGNDLDVHLVGLLDHVLQ